MDLKTLLQSVNTLPPERKEHLLSQYHAGTLTAEEREELVRHLMRFSASQEHADIVEKLLR